MITQDLITKLSLIGHLKETYISNFGQIYEIKDITLIDNRIELKMSEEHYRICDECKKPMSEGYCIAGGENYYCTDECLDKKFTKDDIKEMLLDEEGDSYWTSWEI